MPLIFYSPDIASRNSKLSANHMPTPLSSLINVHAISPHQTALRSLCGLYPVSPPGDADLGSNSILILSCLIICLCWSFTNLIGPRIKQDRISVMLKASTIAFSGPEAGPFLVYGRGEKARKSKIAKIGISQARISDARPYSVS